MGASGFCPLRCPWVPAEDGASLNPARSGWAVNQGELVGTALPHALWHFSCADTFFICPRPVGTFLPQANNNLSIIFI